MERLSRHRWLGFSLGLAVFGLVWAGCSDKGNPHPPDLSPYPRPSVEVSDQTICQRDSVPIGPAESNDNYQYSWAPAAGLDNPGSFQPNASPDETTIYDLLVTETATGVTNVVSVTVFVNPQPVLPTLPSYSVCQFRSVSIGSPAQPGYDYMWTPMDSLSEGYISNPEASPWSTQVYSLMARNIDTGCSATQAVTVTVFPLPEMFILSDRQSVCAGGQVDFSSTIAAASFPAGITWYEWDFNWDGLMDYNGADPPPLTFPTAGTYPVILRVIDSNGCRFALDQSITVFTLPSAIIEETPVFSCAGTGADFNGNFSHGNSDPAGDDALLVSYAWDFDGNGTTDSALPDPAPHYAVPGNYQVTLRVTDSYGCSASATQTYTIPALPPTLTVEAGPDLALGTGGSSQFQASIQGGVGPYGHSWAPVTGLNNPILVGPTVTLNSVGVYSYKLSATDTRGCTASDSARVTVSNIFSMDAGPDRYLCQLGDSVQIGNLAGGGVPPYAYSWSPGAGLSSAVIAQPTATPAGTTLYQVSAADSQIPVNNLDSDLVYVYLPSSVLSSDAGPDQAIGIGGSTQIGIPAWGGYPPYFYSWSPSGGLSDPTLAQPVVVQNKSGTYVYSVQVGDAGSCGKTDSMTLTVVNTLTVNPGPNRVICPGGSVQIGNPAGGGIAPYIYSWSPGAGLSSAAVAQPIATPVTTTVYTVTVTDSGSNTASATVTVALDPVLTAEAGADKSVCAGSSVTLDGSASGGTSPYTYKWIRTDVPATPDYLSSTIIPNPNFSSSSAGAYHYQLTVTDAYSCTAVDTAAAAVNPLPAAEAGPAKSMPGGGSVSLSGSASGGTSPYAYLWTPATYLNNPILAGPTFSGAPLGTYNLNLTVTDVNGCYSSDLTTVTVYAPPTVEAGANQFICYGGSVQIGGLASGGVAPYTYSWSPSGSLNSAIIAQPTASPTSTTMYTVTVTDFASNSVTDTVKVTVNPDLIVNPSAIPVCAGSAVTLYGGVSGGSGSYLFSWVPTDFLNYPDIEDPVFSTAVAGSYEYALWVTDTNSCSKSDRMIATVNPLPVAEAGPAGEMCLGGSAGLNGSASGGTPPYSTYLWFKDTYLDDPDLEGPTFSGAPVGTYSLGVTVTDVNGCFDTDFTQVEVYPLPAADAGPPKTVARGGSTDIGGLTTGGTPAYSFGWICTEAGCYLDDSAIEQPTVSIPLGWNPAWSNFNYPVTYTVDVTDSHACQNSDSMILTVTDSLVASAGTNKWMCSGDSVQIGFAAAGGTAPYTYSWTCEAGTSCDLVGVPAPPNEIEWVNNSPVYVSPPTTTVYRLKTNDSAVNEYRDWVTVTVNIPTASAGPDQTILTGGSTGIGTPGLFGYQYWWEPNAGLSDPREAQPTAYPVPTTTYALTVTDPVGCSATDTVNVTVNMYVAYTVPLDGAPSYPLGYPVGNIILAKFSEPIDTATVSGNFTLWSCDFIDPLNPCPTSEPGSVDITLAAQGIVIFDPTSNLADTTDFEVRLSTGIRSVNGNYLADLYTFSFSTPVPPDPIGDSTAPSVVSRYPVPGQVAVPLNALVTTTFNEYLDPRTVNSVSFTLRETATGNPVAGTVVYDIPSMMILFYPAALLSSTLSYTATIKNGGATGVKDLSGNSVAAAADTVWSFTTGTLSDTIPPFVVSTDPVNNPVLCVSPGKVISATFSEDMDPTTINNTTFRITGPAGNFPGSVTYSAVTRKAYFTPSAFLNFTTAYTAMITTGAKDLSGIQMQAGYSWSFTTCAALLFDNFESGTGNWVLDAPWGLTNASYYSAGNSLTDSPGGNYGNSINISATLASPLDLLGYTTVSLSFWQKYRLKNKDLAYLEICTNVSGTTCAGTWNTLATYKLNKSNWARTTVSLNAYAGDSSVLLRFRLSTDNNRVSDGWYIDDVMITGS